MSVSVSMTVQRAAHEGLDALSWNVQKNWKRNVHITKKVNVMRIGNVMNDKRPRFKWMLAMVVILVVTMDIRIFRMSRMVVSMLTCALPNCIVVGMVVTFMIRLMGGILR